MSVETIGYIGLNHHHRDPYLESLAELPVEVTCACEPDPSFDVGDVDHLGEVPVYRDPHRLIEEADVDAVWVTLPNRDTPGVVRAAAEAGVHVYTEKPAARTAAELAPVADAVADADATVGVSLTWRWHPISRELKQRVESGFFGSLRSFDARFVASALAERDTSHYLYDSDASRGGIVQWLGVHWLDLLSWLFETDPIERVHASFSAGPSDVDVEDGATIKLETASGAVGNLQCGYYLREGRYDTRFDVYGSAAQSSWDPMGPTFGFDGDTSLELDARHTDAASSPHRTINYEYEPCPGYGGRWGLEFVEDFLDACEGDGPVPAGIDDAMRLLRVLDAVYESAEAEEWVAVDSVTDTVPDRAESVTD